MDFILSANNKYNIITGVKYKLDINDKIKNIIISYRPILTYSSRKTDTRQFLNK